MVEHILYACSLIYSKLKVLFNMIVKHGHVPKAFKSGVIVPVIKYNKKNKTDVNNYRPVA
jgi:hypothetical protein